MNLLPGVEAHSITTSRLRTHYYRSGPSDGIPVVMIHGNLSTGRFYEHLWGDAPDRYLFIAPDMRSFGRSDPAPIDATRGLDDWAEDTRALVEALGIDTPPHLVGWSTGGAAIASYAMRHPAASLTFIDPVSRSGSEAPTGTEPPAIRTGPARAAEPPTPTTPNGWPPEIVPPRPRSRPAAS